MRSGAAKGTMHAVAAFILLYLLLPNFIAVPASLTPTSFFAMPAFGDWSLRHYQALASDGRWSAAAFLSLKIAVFSTLLALAAGTAAALALWKMSGTLPGLLRGVLLVPLIVPTAVNGLAFYRTWADLGWLDSIVGMTVAHAIMHYPFVLIAVSGALADLDPRLIQAARNLGASRTQVAAWVIAPSIRAGLATGALLSFLTSWDDVIVSLFLTSVRVETLPKRMLAVVRDDLDPSVAAIAVLSIVATGAVAWVLTRAPRTRAG